MENGRRTGSGSRANYLRPHWGRYGPQVTSGLGPIFLATVEGAESDPPARQRCLKGRPDPWSPCQV